jgi:hypothetical protein
VTFHRPGYAGGKTVVEQLERKKVPFVVERDEGF